MSNYKADITLNEKDSLIDVLSAQKDLVKTYATCLTEGVSKEFRRVVRENFSTLSDDQLSTFFLMTERGYYKVESAPEEQIKQLKTQNAKIKNQLS